ncbi:hypothetical protein [Streptomyces sp. YS-3]|uniref:hypothetical protein n=1 Tax=Streptomyces sp. YS-3 TaxID=3381352 RepID=UPI003862A150
MTSQQPSTLFLPVGSDQMLGGGEGDVGRHAVTVSVGRRRTFDRLRRLGEEPRLW